MQPVKIYRRGHDAELWEWVEEHSRLTGDSVARIITQALRSYRRTVEANAAQEAAER
jgi:hypothetical protein